MLLLSLTCPQMSGLHATDENGHEGMNGTPTIGKGLEMLIITGSRGRIGSSFIDRVGGAYTEMGFDREGPPHPPPETEHVIACDLGSDESAWATLDEVRRLGQLVEGSRSNCRWYPFCALKFKELLW